MLESWSIESRRQVITPLLHYSITPGLSHVVRRDYKNGNEFVRREQAAFRVDNGRDHDRRFLGDLGDDRDRRTAKFDRNRNQLSWFEYFPICEISGQSEHERQREEKISEQARHHLPAGVALLPIDGRKCARNLSQELRL